MCIEFCLDGGVHLGAQDFVRVLVAHAAGQPVVRAVIAGQAVARVVNGDPAQELWRVGLSHRASFACSAASAAS